MLQADVKAPRGLGVLDRGHRGGQGSPLDPGAGTGQQRGARQRQPPGAPSLDTGLVVGVTPLPWWGQGEVPTTNNQRFLQSLKPAGAEWGVGASGRNSPDLPRAGRQVW